MSNKIADQPEELVESIRPYASPEIVYELKLETHAGSPLIIDPLIDPLSVDPTAAR